MEATLATRRRSTLCMTIAVTALLHAPVIWAQLTGSGTSEVIKQGRPLDAVANLLAGRYAQGISYEESMWLWKGDLRIGDDNWRWARWPKDRTFVLPAGLTPEQTPVLDAPLLQGVVNAYDRQNPDGPTFRVTSTKLGLLILPEEVHDESGNRVAATTLLDTVISVPVALRTPAAHLAAIRDAVNAASGQQLKVQDFQFNSFFAPNGLIPLKWMARGDLGKYSITWGAQLVTAREALISLLDLSGTTFTWELLCQSSAQPQDRFCVLNVGPIQLTVTGPDGKPERKSLTDDRCGKCPSLRPPVVK